VFAPASALRGRVVPSGRGRRRAGRAGARPKAPEQTGIERHRAPASLRLPEMRWAARLKRVFAIEIERCQRCGGTLRVIASIEDEGVIQRILAHLGRADESLDRSHPSRAPPQGELLL